MLFLKKYRGYVLFYLLALLPLIFWITNVGPASLTETPSSALKAIAKGSVLIGFTMYVMLPLLSMRHWLIEKLFDGLDRVYRLHRLSGKLVFYLLWIHPVFLAYSAMANGKTIGTIWDWSSLLVISGLFSIALFSGIIGITIYAHIRHQSWIFIHRFLGWLIPIFFVHGMLAGAQMSKNIPLFVYMLTLSVIGFMAFLYRAVFFRWIKKFTYEVAEVHKISTSVVELVLKPKNFQLPYIAGQYAYVSIFSEGVDPEPHPFSFTTAPNGPYIRFVIKELGDDTATIKHTAVGSLVKLEGPYGTFSYKKSKNRHQAWIAGGVGVTPFLSMARSLSKKSPYKINFFYAADKLADTVFLNELIDIRKLVPDVMDLTVVSRETSGFVTAELLTKELGDLQKYDFFVCGPPPMLKPLKEQLVASGVKPDAIHTEEFSML